MSSPSVDRYLSRSTLWPTEARRLRTILLGTGLTEALKWGKPCYADGDHNIVIIQEIKAFLALMFFKGALLDDPAGVLEAQGPNSRSARRITFTSLDDVDRLADIVRAYVAAAVEVERSGAVLPPPAADVLADVLQHRLDTDATFRRAFEALTPGARREYHLHIAGAKQQVTRAARLEKCVERILAGRRFRDR